MTTNNILGTLLMLISVLGMLCTGLSAVWMNAMLDTNIALAHLLMCTFFMAIGTLGGWMLDNPPTRN